MELARSGQPFALTRKRCQAHPMATQKGAAPASAPITMLHIFPSFGYGGQQARFAALAKGFGTAYRHHVVSLDQDVSAKGLLPKGATVSVECLPLAKSAILAPINYWRLRRLFGRIKPDIVCTYNWGSIEAAFANAFGAKRPHVHFEDGFGPDERVDKQHARRVRARRMVLKNAHVVAPSHALEEAASALWRIAPAQVHRIPNGVQFSRFQGSPPALRPSVTVGTVGALRPEKNHQRLIDAYTKADRSKKARLKIVGDGPEQGRLIKSIKANDARRRITLAGATSAPETAYSEFDIFVLSSDTEQAPLTIMEAMAAGLPIVATNVGEVASLVSTENRALITPLGDDDAFMEALSHLLQNSDARASLGAANRKKAKAEFSYGAMVKRHHALYQSLLRNRR